MSARSERLADHDYVRMFRVDAWIAQGRRCAYCWEPISRKEATADHIKPRISGGLTKRDNILAACEPCNKLKAWRSKDKFKQLIKCPPTDADMELLMANMRRRIWLRTARAERRILRAVGLG